MREKSKPGIFGGVAQIGKEAADAKTEFWMGLAGPSTSALIGALCLGIAWMLGWAGRMTSSHGNGSLHRG